MPPHRFAGALALAASSAAGLKRQFGSDAKPLHAGLAARSGLEAALLAEAGIGGNPDLMEGRFGFIACYGGGGAAQPPARPPSRGACAMHSDPVLRKPWPCCAYTHRAIEAALRLAPAIGVDTIAAGTIRIPEPFFRVAPFIEPQDPSQARFSLLYCVCAALADGALSTASFTADAVARPGVRALMRRFEISAYDPGDELEDMSPAHPDSVCLRLRDGREVRETVAQVKGGPAHPLSDAEILRKFTDCGAPEGLAQRLLSGTTETALRFSDEQWTA